jgi:dTDP-glucose 4,6-dehydratase
LYRILVTGGAGFIGSNFIFRSLDKLDCKILNIDKLTYSGNLDNLSEIESNHTFLQADISNKEIIKKSINDFKPNIIINFAAESHVDRSIDSYSDFVNTNILGTINLLNISLDYWNNNKNDNFKFIHISTDEVYGSLGNEGSFSEESTYSPSSPYSASKASSDHFVNSWNKTFGLPTIITNCSNNYGPFQFPEKLIPLMIINTLNEDELPIYGNGENIRDWIHVQDHCDALIRIIEKGEVGEKYNIGGNCERKNIEIVEKICETIDLLNPRGNNKSHKELIKFVSDRPGHDYRYAVNCNKISNTLDWKPQISFDDGIGGTVKWYVDHSDWWGKIIEKKYNLKRLGTVK